MGGERGAVYAGGGERSRARGAGLRGEVNALKKRLGPLVIALLLLGE